MTPSREEPIDGTTNYLYNLPAYVVSVAAVVGNPHAPGGWQTVAGAVCEPVGGHVYHARLGAGAWHSVLADGAEPGERVALHGSDPAGLGQALVATGFGYAGQARARQAAVLAHVLPLVRDIRRLGSAALDLCLVAQGVLDAFYEDLLNPWDVAAGMLIVAEAGGIVSGWAPAEPALPAVVAGSPAIHLALCEVLDRVRGASM